MGVDAEMFVRHRGRLSDTETRLIAAELCSRVGVGKFMVWRNRDLGIDPHHALSILPLQDGLPVFEYHDAEPIIGRPEEQFIRVHFYTRYYGVGYERGDWLSIKATAEFLEQRIPGSRIWYGGDSSGIACEPFGPGARSKLHKHWLEHGHDPYVNYFDRGMSLPKCEFCGGRRLNENGGGRDVKFLSCAGCGGKWVIYSEQLIALPEKSDFFDWRKHVLETAPC